MILDYVRRLFGKNCTKIGGAWHSTSAAIQHLRVNHRRPSIAVAKEFLHRADVVAHCDQVGGERLSKQGGWGRGVFLRPPPVHTFLVIPGEAQTG